MIGRTIIEPVHDASRRDQARLGIVGENLDLHSSPDDSADLLLRAVCQNDFSVKVETSEHYADLHADLIDEDHARLALVDGAGELAQRLRHEPGLKADVR